MKVKEGGQGNLWLYLLNLKSEFGKVIAKD